MAGQILPGKWYPAIMREVSPGEYEFAAQRTGQINGDASTTYPDSEEGGDYHDVEGVSSWPSFDQGNSVMVSRGTVGTGGGNPGPLPPEPVQLSPGDILGRLASGDADGVRLDQMQALINSSLLSFYDVKAPDGTTEQENWVLTLTNPSSHTPGGLAVADRLQFLPVGAGVSVGTTAPALDSTLWLYDDGTFTGTELYYKDIQRDRWVSVAKYTYEFQNTAAVTIGTGFYDTPTLGTSSATNGFPIFDNMLLVGVDWAILDNTLGAANSTVSLHNGPGAAFAAITCDADALGGFQKTGQNLAVPIAAGPGNNILNMKQAANQGATKSTFRWHFRKTRA